MQIIAAIPARGGSKFVPQKNIRNIGGHPLITYTIAIAKMSKIIERVIVSTDSSEIANIAKKYGAEVPFIRPSEFAQDDSGDFEWLEHLINYLEKKEDKSVEYLVHLRPTTPFRKIGVVDEGINYILKNPQATSLRSVSPTPQPPHKIFKMEGLYLKGFFDKDPRPEYYNLPRQTFPQTYVPNGYVDVVRASAIKNKLIHGDKMLGFITDTVPDIDDESDFNNATKVLSEKRFDPLMEFIKEHYD